MRVSRRILPPLLPAIRPLVRCALPAALLAPLLAGASRAQIAPARATPAQATPTQATRPQATHAQATRPQGGVQTTRARGVTVEKSEVTVRRRRFDRRNPPPDMPPLGPRADAVTQSRFGCAASVQYSVVSRRPDARGRRGAERGGCTATARVESMQVKLDLDVTIWVPTNARAKLVAHEEGHRVISERVYDDAAAAVALAEAQKLIGHTVTARGDNCDAAADAAIREANEKFCQAYLEATSGWSTRVGNRYDDVTDHGKRSDPGVDEAIRVSFEREPQREPQEEAARD